MSILHTSDTDFAPSRVAEHYTPLREKRETKVAASTVLACIIGLALAACFFLGLSS
jgi:hypothetical protein